jgi:hypothetical protein
MLQRNALGDLANLDEREDYPDNVFNNHNKDGCIIKKLSLPL